MNETKWYEQMYAKYYKRNVFKILISSKSGWLKVILNSDNLQIVISLLIDLLIF
jgi:hypothetical protein